MYDDKEVSIQITQQADNETADLDKKHLIMIKYWHPVTWGLDDPIEIWLDKDANLQDFALALSS
jgi:hypothetical protein